MMSSISGAGAAATAAKALADISLVISNAMSSTGT